MISLLAQATLPPPKSSSKSSQFNHTHSRRAYISSQAYKHPAAILLELCNSVEELHQILPLIIKNGLFTLNFYQTKLVSLFCFYGRITEASNVFEQVKDKDDALYHTMLKGYAKSSNLDGALDFFCRMRYEDVKPVVYNFAYLLKVLGDKNELKKGMEIHGNLITSGFSLDLFAMTGVASMYAKCRLVTESYKMFERMPEKDLVSWNMIISGFSQNGYANMALDLVSRMHGFGQKPDSITIVSIIPAAADLGCSRTGKSIHGYVIRTQLVSIVSILTALVDMYAKCGFAETARLIFDEMKQKTVIAWNSMINGYTQNGNPEEALKLFRAMLDERVQPTEVTIMAALHACADLGDLDSGKIVHKLLDRLNLGSNVSVMNSLISMYSKCNQFHVAAKIFDNLQSKTLVSWNAMILGFSQNGRVEEALSYFCQMQSRNIKPDSFTMVSVINAMAELSLTRQAKWIHALVIRHCLDKNVFVMTALVDMYAKCGDIHTAREIFNMTDKRHVITWNTMIDGYGTHGLGKAAISLFDEMQTGIRNGIIKPNNVTFLCMLSACSHSGLVEEGLNYFIIMKKHYGIEPSMDHYGAMVDLLGRAGRLNEAWDFIQNMPVQPAINVYGAMLGACRIHKNVELGEKAANKLFELNPNEGGYHVLVTNMYIRASAWDKVAEVRTMMENKGLKRTRGCSLVELRNEVHSFYSGSTSHPQSKEIYVFLEKLREMTKLAGYVSKANSVHDEEDNVKEQLLNSHSEKLAIGFALLNTTPGTTIHVRKNLRVCGDCHSATKYISLVTGREIIVRDMHRFHHFKNGICSCGDYW